MKNFKLPEEFLEKYKTMNPPFGPIGFVVYYRTYSRDIDGRKEQWWETCRREVEEIIKLGADFSEQEAQELYDDCFNLRCSFSGRAKWQLGSETVAKIGGSSLNNCWGLVLDHPKAFVFAFDQLMLGGGVGYNLQREFIYQLPKIKKNVKVTRKETNDADFIVPDSREGWCQLLEKVLDSWFHSGKSFSYSTICIRTKGAKIKGFGGIASGPEELCLGIEDICKIFEQREGKKLRSIDCLDIMNIIGRVVVSGNTRRGSQISIGDMDDKQFLDAKRWDKGPIPNWRNNSNNSIVCNDIELLPESFWETFGKDPKTGYAKGENYGLINLKLSRKKGRILDCHRVDKDVSVFNPCAEISLGPPHNSGEGECCNLIELFINRIESKDEFIRIAKNCYRVVKTISSLEYHWPKTNKIIHKNMRLGISVTGLCEWLPNLGREEASNWLDSCYKELELEDERYSKLKGFPKSIKISCQKPSGTLSSLISTSPGVHPFYSPFYIRRIRFASNNPLIPELQKRNHPMEPEMLFDGSLNHDTTIVSFPIKSPQNGIMSKDMSAVDQMELVKFMNTFWSDNSTSVTVYYKEEELPEIRSWLKENYNDSIKSISFLLHSDHGFKQAPYEEITEEKYNEMISKIEPLVNLDVKSFKDSLDSKMECEGGSCPIT